MKNYQDVARELMVVERAAWWNPRVRRILKAAPLVVLFLLLNTRAARAACSFNPAPDPTADGSSNSLRHAVQMANASGQDCLIQLQAGTYTLTIANTQGQENEAAQGDLDITDSGHTVTVQGQGAGVSIVNANRIDRVFQVLGGANAVFSKLTIEGGVAQDDGSVGAQPGTKESEGGGLLVQDGGHVTLSQVWVERNQALGGSGPPMFGIPGGPTAAGGGLFLSAGTVDLTASQVSGNAASGRTRAGNGGDAAGGGMFIAGGDLSLRQTTVSGNSVTGGNGAGAYSGLPGNGGVAQGGGLFVASGHISLVNSTFFANTAKSGINGSSCFHLIFHSSFMCRPGGSAGAAGGGLYLSSGSVSLAGDTLASNQALANYYYSNTGLSTGGGIANASVGLYTNTTLIGDNTQDSASTNNGDDVSGPVRSSYSLIGQTAGATITNDGGNIFNVDPELDPKGLRSNGGPTQTVALEDGSPAIDKGANAICAAAPPTGLGGIDQRGFARFRHGDNLCDIGAFEFITLLVQPTIESFGREPVGQQTPAQTIYVTNNQTTSITLSKSIGGTDPADFIIVSTTCGGNLPSHAASCTVSIAFSPRATGTRSALLTISDSPDRTSPYTVKLDGVGG